jgi:hypothetical protein
MFRTLRLHRAAIKGMIKLVDLLEEYPGFKDEMHVRSMFSQFHIGF